MEIMKNRCDLVESQIKILQKMVDDTLNENKQLKDLIEKLYFMIQEMEKIIKNNHIEDLKEFATYLGIDFEDYLEFLHPDVDFDDYSR